MYGVFKKFVADNSHDALAKMLNSAYTSAETRKTLRVLHDHIGYYSQLVIHNDRCYVTFINSIDGRSGDDSEYQSNITLTLATFELERALSEDFDYQKDVKLSRFGGIGAKVAGHTARSGLQAPSMLVLGNKLYISFSFDDAEDKKWASYAYEYDLESDTITDEYTMNISYKGEVHPLNIDTINRIYAEEGYNPVAPCLISFTNSWSEYKGEYYNTMSVGVTDAQNGMIFKTRDFRTIEFVSMVKGNDNGQCEVISRIHNGKLYMACRQPWTTPYLVFIRYDLETGEFTTPYKIEDGNSRPGFFVYNNEIYLFNTLDEAGSGRHYANISKVRTETAAHNGRNAPVSVAASLYECGNHHCFVIYNGKIYFSMQKRERINFGELKLKEFSPTKVNQKLLELFGDIE